MLASINFIFHLFCFWIFKYRLILGKLVSTASVDSSSGSSTGIEYSRTQMTETEEIIETEVFIIHS